MWCLKFIWLFVYILFLKCTLNQVSPCLSIHSALHLSACEQMCTDHFPLVCLFKKNSIGCYIFIRLNRQIFNISTEVKNPVSGCMQILVTIVIHLCTLSPHSHCHKMNTNRHFFRYHVSSFSCDSSLLMNLQYEYLSFTDFQGYVTMATNSGEVLTWKVSLVTISTSAFTQTSPRAPALSHTG